MARPDVRFNTAAPPSVPRVDLAFTGPDSDQSAPVDHVADVIDLRDRPVLSETEARAILGVGPDADWAVLRDAHAARLGQLDVQRYQVNTAYATLRLLATH